MTALVLALVLLAGILAVVELIRSRATSLTAWAVLALAFASALPHLLAL